MEESVSTSTDTIKALHINPTLLAAAQEPTSQPSSPTSALPSPGSPSSDSISSLPSVSSSFFYSSGATSPHHHHSDHSRGGSDDLRLVIPSLALPAALPHATTFGRTLGDLRLLILGEKGVGKTTFANLLLKSNDDVVEIGGWEYFDEEGQANVLRASTHWIEHGDAHGLEKFEPARNVEIIELPGYDQHAEASALTNSILSLIHTPFRAIHGVLHPDQAPSATLANLLSSPFIPFYTALILLSKTTPSPVDYSLIGSLSPHIPIIVLPSLSSKRSSHHLSSFRPSTSTALCSGLFKSPDTIATLRSEAVDRFLRWREIERTVHSLALPPFPNNHQHTKSLSTTSTPSKWNKAEWEAEWDYTFSRDVAEHRIATTASLDLPSNSYGPPSFDPLHLPSIFMFSLSLFGPLRTRIFGDSLPLIRRRGLTLGKFPSWGLITVVGAFCAGIGIGLIFTAR